MRMFRYVIFLLCLVQIVYASHFVSRVARSQISTNENLPLQFVFDGQTKVDPDFSPLTKDFEILGTGKSQQVSVLDGKSTAETLWTVLLKPRHSGEIEIPSIHLDVLASTPLKIQVNKTVENKKPSEKDSGKNKSIIMKTSVSSENLYVNTPIIYNVKIYYDAAIDIPSLTEPLVSQGNIVQLGQPDQSIEMLDNRTYQVTIWHYSVTPNKVGHLRIAAPILQGQVADVSRHDRLINLSERAIRVTDATKDLNVEVMPAIENRELWLFAENVEVDAQWQDPIDHLEVGKPFVRVYTIRARGVRAQQLPSIAKFLHVPVKYYGSDPILKEDFIDQTIVSSRQEKMTFIPSQADNIVLPAVTVHWWDLLQKKWKVAEIRSETVKVNAALTAPVKLAPVANFDDLTTPSIFVWMKKQALFLAISALFAMGWLVTLFYFLVWKKRSKHLSIEESELLQILKNACFSNDAKLISQTLLRWAKQQWPDDLILSLSHIANKFNHEALTLQIAMIEKSVYDVSEHTIDGEKLWITFTLARETQEKKIKPVKNSVLPPLY